MLAKVFPIKLKDGNQAAAEAIVQEFAPKGPGAEEGTLSFRVYRDPSNPDYLLFVEHFADRACLPVQRRREEVLGAVHRRAGAKVSMRSIVAFAPVRRGAVPSAPQQALHRETRPQAAYDAHTGSAAYQELIAGRFADLIVEFVEVDHELLVSL